MNEEKICTLCQLIKNIDDFDFKSKKKSIRHSACKDCRKSYNKQHYKDNKNLYLEKAKQNNKVYKKRNYDFLIEFKKDKPCMDCGQLFPHYVMDFDHLPSEVKKDNIAKIKNSSLSVSILQKEIEKCELICSNCHRIRTWNRYHNIAVSG